MTMIKERDFNKENKDNLDRKYAYNFDYDVMHPLIMKSFTPFFKDGNVLELGSFEGKFTIHLQRCFADITCIEASSDAIRTAKDSMSDSIEFIEGAFETVELKRSFDNIIMTHVLEHVENPSLVLSKIRTKWLAKGGRLFLACPNANAASRQIAVKMGIITHNEAVTPGEAQHGHYRTYNFETLEDIIKASSYRIVNKSGVFFKALANFQWDELLKREIVSKEYLEGCYLLGQEYPDLCSSIVFVCENQDCA
tara:strand:- start:149 stop:904 length:756 start_codon:yes stop_codon:yes gene_type:complete